MTTKTPAIQICIENFINGNLSDAKEKAKRFSIRTLKDYLAENYGWSGNKSTITAFYLKNQATFQEACDAK